MKNKFISLILITILFMIYIPSASAANTYAPTFSTGWYYAKLSVDTASYGMNISKISNNSVTFSVTYVGKNGSPIYSTDEITAAISNDKAIFNWSDSWSNSGNGIIKFEENHITLSMYQTYTAPINRGSLDQDNIILYAEKSDMIVTPVTTPITETLPYFTVTQYNNYTEIVNNSDNSFTPTIIVAEYENNLLKRVHTSKFPFSAGEKRTITIGSGISKVFVWDSLKGMRPLNK